jgi:hypothetical protein
MVPPGDGDPRAVDLPAARASSLYPRHTETGTQEDIMAKYLLTSVEPAGPIPSDDELAAIIRDVDALDQELRTAGLWVFAGGLEQPSQAKTLRHEGDDVVVHDGPFVETAEHVGGFTIVDVHDEAEAIGWARRFAVATGLPMEVRAFR